MSQYKDNLTLAMSTLANDSLIRFVGYGLLSNKGANGTIRDVPEKQTVEVTTTEALMMGMAVGMSLRGLRPVVYIERMDFVPIALDAIINQLDSIARLSNGQFKPAAIIRVMVGSRGKPPFTALTHTRDLSDGIERMVSFPVRRCHDAELIKPYYFEAYNALVNDRRSTMIIDYREKM